MAAATNTAVTTATPAMKATAVLGLTGVGGMTTAATPTPVSDPPESAAPKPPALERTFSSARLLDERTGTKRKANAKTMTRNFAERFIFIVSPQEMESFFAWSLQFSKDLYYYKNWGFCQIVDKHVKIVKVVEIVKVVTFINRRRTQKTRTTFDTMNKISS
jgi:hypothetical protein